jgi:translation elongation factor P
MGRLVMKFGGTSVANIDRIRNVARHVKREVDAGHDVAVVVSAMSGKTNELVDWCRDASPLHDAREYDAVVASGEQVTSGLLAIALQGIGIQARSWQGWQIPIRTSDAHASARILEIDGSEIPGSDGSALPISQLSDTKIMNQVVAHLLTPVGAYAIPAIVLDDSTSKSAVATVFEKVNIGGLALNVFELLTAVYAGDADYYKQHGDDFRLNDDWKAAKKSLEVYPALGGLESTDFLQIVSLLSSFRGTGATTARREDILNLKLKNLTTGSITDERVHPDDKVDVVYLDTKDFNYSYKDGDDFVFVDAETFEPVTLSGAMVGDMMKYLRENDPCKITFYDSKALSMELPQTVTLKVTETEPGIKGATAAAQTKAATLETGIVVQVPSFITEGEAIVIQTEDGKYLKRAAKEGK